MTEIKISKKQAQEFAEVIFADIKVYIQTHQTEYEEFLREEKTEEET